MTARERATLTGVIETFVAPVAPLPPVRDTDAVPAFERSLAAGPRLNALAIRAGIQLVRLGLRRGPLAKAIASLAYLHYYGDDRVLRLLGYDPDAVLARAAEVRAA
jgi:hypothetical protein